MTDPLPFIDVAIVGGGPCGLGAAWRMTELQRAGANVNYLLLEGKDELGGSSVSFRTEEGFVFDYGGHILYPHANYEAFGDLLDSLVEFWDESLPARGVYYDGRLIPYPVQQNIHRLPFGKLASAFAGLTAAKLTRRAASDRGTAATDSLERYLRARFGRGLSKYVMEPINQKMWATSPADMGSEWTSHRSGSKAPNVPNVSLAKVAASIFTRRDHRGWEGSAAVRYPRRGGTGAIWKSLAARLPPSNIRLGTKVVEIDADARQLRLSNGDLVRYDHLISTMPLDELTKLVGIETSADLSPFRYASASFVGMGIYGPRPAWLDGVHSFHMPDPRVPCWRVSFPASLSRENVPDLNSWSILCEISHNDGGSYDKEGAAASIEQHLRSLEIVPRQSAIVSSWLHTIKHGYPVPFLGRDRLLSEVHAKLAALGIISRGRFGGWKYEVSNMDHTFMQGAEAVDRILNGIAERTYITPELIN